MTFLISPMATGNGAYVVHKILERYLRHYKVLPYHPYRTFFPLSLLPLGHHSRPSLIHTTPDYAIFHKRLGIPLIITFHNYVLDSFMSQYSSALQRLHYRTDLRWFTTLAVHQADIITAVSHFTAGLVKRELRPNKEIRVIYNGVNEQTFVPSKRSQHNTGPIRVLFCGNLIHRKGAQWLIPIADRLNTGIEIIYTSGMRTNNSLANHPRICCLGKIPYEDMPVVYQQADLLLFPTVREGLSLAALESMACGLPVVASDCSSMPELIDHGRGGFLCPIGNIEAFADKINQLADDICLRNEMGAYNRIRVESSFTLAKMISNYQDLFEEIGSS